MFTGLVEEIGLIKHVLASANEVEVTVGCKKVCDDAKIGDSIAINGACHSVVEVKKNQLRFQISNETLKSTTFTDLQTNQKINLERAMKLSDRIGGHLVSGHIDDTAKLIRTEKDGFCYRYEFETKDTKYLIFKGSVCINGVSLTIVNVKNNNFSVNIIPQTLENTTLKDLKIGEYVNIETDMLAKYVEKFLILNDNDGNNSKVDMGFLSENGFL